MNLIIQHYFMKQHFLSYLIALLLFPLYEMQAAYQPEFSTAAGPLPCKARQTILYENSRRFFLEI